MTEVLNNYVTILDIHTKSEATKNGYINAIKKFLKENSRPYRMSKDDLYKYMSLFRKRYSDSYYNIMGSALILLYKEVYKQQQKMLWFKPIKLKPVYNDIVSDEMFVDMMREAKNIKHKSIIILLYSTGIREGEMLNIKLGDINWSDNTIFIHSLKNGKNRHVYMHHLARRYIMKYINKYKPSIYLFEGQAGGKYSATSVRNIFKNTSNAKVYPHKMRHTFITKTIEREDVFATMSIVGHSSPQSTLHYNHIAKDRLQRMYNPLDTINY